MTSKREAGAISTALPFISTLLAVLRSSNRTEIGTLLFSVLMPLGLAVALFLVTVLLEGESGITAQAVRVFCIVILIRISFTITKSFDFKKATDDLSDLLERKNAVLERTLGEEDAKHAQPFELGFNRKVLTHLSDIADGTASIIGKFVGGRCAVSIKVLCSPPDGAKSQVPHVYTLLRDKGSWDRSQLPAVPDKFPYTDNSAFKHLLDQKEPIFFSNDLEALARKGNYENTNPLWPSYYNQVVVVPIGNRERGTGRYSSIVGFLCVDTLSNAGANLGSMIVRQEIAKISDVVYTTFRLLYALYEGRSAPSDDVGWISRDHSLAPAQEQTQLQIESVLDRMITIDTSTALISDLNRTRVAHAYPGSDLGVAISSPEKGQVAMTTQQDEEARRLMREAQFGFSKVFENTPSVLLEFQSAFNYRAKTSELPESSGTASGLERVLSSLLRVSPPSEMVEAYRNVETVADNSTKPAEQLLDFKAKISAALIGLSVDNPITLKRFYRNLRTYDVSSNYAIGALLLSYVKNKDSYPL